MKSRILLPCGIATFLALTTLSGCSLTRPPPVIATATPTTLLGMHWRLTQLGNEVVDNPANGRDVHFQLQPSSSNVVGNSGCNRMFGRYALEGASLKFDAMGGTKMACDSRMELESRFLAMFSTVAGWKITGNTLELLDTAGSPVATFAALPATG